MAKLSLQMQFSVISFTIIINLASSSALASPFQRMRQELLPAENRKIQIFPIRKTVAESQILCVRDCHADVDCSSVNYHRISHHCSLNSVARAQFPDKFIKDFGSVYFDADRETPLYSLPCCSSSCKELLQAGHDASGIYTIYPAGFTDGLKVYCDMETDGGGWIVIQRRQDGSVDFYRKWADYRAGFGNLSGEFWIGNGILRRLTESAGTWKLRVDLESWDNITAYAEYGLFEVSGNNYQLKIDSYNDISTAGNSLAFHNGKMFTTKDNDHSEPSNCALRCKGAWWYSSSGCFTSNLNTLYGETVRYGITWNSWRGSEALKASTMKICLSF